MVALPYSRGRSITLKKFVEKALKQKLEREA